MCENRLPYCGSASSRSVVFLNILQVQTFFFSVVISDLFHITKYKIRKIERKNNIYACIDCLTSVFILQNIHPPAGLNFD